MHTQNGMKIIISYTSEILYILSLEIQEFLLAKILPLYTELRKKIIGISDCCYKVSYLTDFHLFCEIIVDYEKYYILK